MSRAASLTLLIKIVPSNVTGVPVKGVFLRPSNLVRELEERVMDFAKATIVQHFCTGKNSPATKLLAVVVMLSTRSLDMEHNSLA